MTTSNGHNSTKINQLLKVWPPETVATQTWLNKLGIYRQLADTYCKHDWLTRLDGGAYTRSGDTVSWDGALYALQEQLELKVHVAADSALNVLGLDQNIPLGKGNALWLFIDSSETKHIPLWFKKHFAKEKAVKIKHSNLFSKNWSLGLQRVQVKDYHINISSAERAIMECLYLVQDKFSLEHTSLLMEKLRTLRSELCEELLINCSSIIVKRLFLFLAELHNHHWFKAINQTKVDLGSGKRQVTESGVYIAKYKLVLPDLNKHEGYSNG